MIEFLKMLYKYLHPKTATEIVYGIILYDFQKFRMIMQFIESIKTSWDSFWNNWAYFYERIKDYIAFEPAPYSTSYNSHAAHKLVPIILLSSRGHLQNNP